VIGEGSGAEFMNHEAASRAHVMGVVPSKALTASQLEAAGRNFILQRLAKSSSCSLESISYPRRQRTEPSPQPVTSHGDQPRS
jgi:hypothetical protein